MHHLHTEYDILEPESEISFSKWTYINIGTYDIDKMHSLISGDCPSPPGMPLIQQLKRDVYQVIWDPSRENGAHVELYWLEGKTEGGKREKREVNFTLDTESSTRVEDNTVENDDDSDNWVLYYNGTGMIH